MCECDNAVELACFVIWGWKGHFVIYLAVDKQRLYLVDAVSTTIIVSRSCSLNGSCLILVSYWLGGTVFSCVVRGCRSLYFQATPGLLLSSAKLAIILRADKGHPTEKSVGCLKNGRIRNHFGRMIDYTPKYTENKQLLKLFVYCLFFANQIFPLASINPALRNSDSKWYISVSFCS